MHKKNSSKKKLHNDTKQNMMQNGHLNFQPLFEPKRKIIKKAEHPCHPLQQNHKHKNPQQLRYLCEQQEKLILAQYRSNKLFHHQEFYEYVRGQLANSKICKKIMMIKQMSNQQALQQLSRIQELKLRDGGNNDLVGFLYLGEKCGEDQIQTEQKFVFRKYEKKISMIQDNDDAYLQQLGVVHYNIRQQNIIQEQNQREEPEVINYVNYQKHQYYVNDDVFEF